MRRSRFGTAAGHGAEQHILRAGELLEVAAAAHSCGRLEVKEAVVLNAREVPAHDDKPRMQLSLGDRVVLG